MKEFLMGWAFALSATVAAAPGVALGAEKDFSGAICVVLYRALFGGEKPTPSGPNLILEIEKKGGKWQRIYGTALGGGNGDHFGSVIEGAIEPETIHLKVMVTVGADLWVGGGEGTYTISLKRQADGTWKGVFDGIYRDQPVSGNAVGTVYPPRPILIRDFKPLEAEEHPRLLLRKHELPKLREKLKTPFGLAFMDKAKAATGDAILQSMLYQLTGEKTCAERALTAVQKYGMLGDAHGGGSGSVGHDMVAACVAYDMCAEAWPEGSRKEIFEKILDATLFMQKTLPVASANFHPCSNYYGPGKGMTSIASLLLLGGKGEEPKAPVPPEEIASKGGLEALLMVRSGKMDKYKADYPAMVAKWKARLQEWQESGGADLERLRMFHTGLLHMRRHYLVGVGEGGMQAEAGTGYGEIAVWLPLNYATMYARMFGQGPSLYPDITNVVVRRMMQVIFLQNGKQLVQPINNAGGLNPGHVAVAFPIAADEYKPGLLWAWNHICGVTDEKTVGNIFGKGWGGSLATACAFVNYPLDLKPEHPDRVMPRTWQARGLGLYVFRSGWEGKDEFVGQVFLKSMPIGGWNKPNAGTFGVVGLGHTWNWTSDTPTGIREQENIVFLPEDDPSSEGSCGRLTYLELAKDGSGSLTTDLSDTYATTKTMKVKKKAAAMQVGGIQYDKTGNVDAAETDRHLRLYDRNGLRMPDNWADSGIKSMRSVAFDFSGKSGSPCLMVLVDNVTGGKRKHWFWQLPHIQSGSRDAEPRVKVEGNTFTVSYPDAYMKATFLAPVGVKVESRADTMDAMHKAFSGVLKRVVATGADTSAGDFFVVITFQRKDAPEVKVEGKGLGAKITVGKQTVAFDGQRIVLQPLE